MNYNQYVEEFNSDDLDDFRHLIKSQMESRKDYKNGFQIFKAFMICYDLFNDFLIFHDTDTYNNALDCYFKILFSNEV